MGTTASPQTIPLQEARDALWPGGPRLSWGGWAPQRTSPFVGPREGPKMAQSVGPGLSTLRGLPTLMAAHRAEASDSTQGPAEPSVFLEDPKSWKYGHALEWGLLATRSQWSPGTLTGAETPTVAVSVSYYKKEFHRLGGLKQQTCISHRSGGRKSKTKVPADSVPWWVLLLACSQLSSHYVHTWQMKKARALFLFL